MTSTTRKNTAKCTQDIRSIPQSKYALPTDKRQKNQLCQERRSLMMQLTTYANGDGTGIKVSVPTLATEMGWSDRTVQRRLKELRILGFEIDGEIDPHFHTRTRSIDIGKVTGRVTDSPEKGDKLKSETVTNSQGKGDKLAGDGDKLAGKGDKLAIQSALPSYNRPSTVLLTGADAADCRKDGSGSAPDSNDTLPGTEPDEPQSERQTSNDSGYSKNVEAGRADQPQPSRLQKVSDILKAKTLTPKIIIPATEPLQDSLAGTSRGALVRAAREADHPFGIGDECICCHIKLAMPDRPFCRDCDGPFSDCGGTLATCAMVDPLMRLHQDGGEWRTSIFAPFNQTRLMDVAGPVVSRGVLKALHSTPKNALANLDRVLQLIEHRIESVSRLKRMKPTAGVVAALEDLYTVVLLLSVA